VGVGYGEVLNVVTENAAPTAINVSVTGTVGVGEVLTASYTYQDTENDVESGTTFQWYVADAISGTNEIAITGATSSTFTVQAAQFGKFICVSVTPKAATGTTTGVEVKSAYRDAEPTSVTFTYNGSPVTYNVIVSPTTNRRWLDRNLGASGVASSQNDFVNYGDLFQWGRKADGHQLTTRSGPAATQFVTVNGTTAQTAPYEYSDIDVPTHSKVIFTGSAAQYTPWDWRMPKNDNLWQGVNGINNPCPTGFRVPTKEEWAAEGLTSMPDGFSKLKLTLTGTLFAGDALFYLADRGWYWSSSTSLNSQGNLVYATRIFLNEGYTEQSNSRSSGNAVRCIKDESN
jgi:uncharacterized protein (TIGR02145 family)